LGENEVATLSCGHGLSCLAILSFSSSENKNVGGIAKQQLTPR